MEKRKLPVGVLPELEDLARIECRSRGWKPTREKLDELIQSYGDDYYDSAVPNPRHSISPYPEPEGPGLGVKAPTDDPVRPGSVMEAVFRFGEFATAQEKGMRLQMEGFVGIQIKKNEYGQFVLTGRKRVKANPARAEYACNPHAYKVSIVEPGVGAIKYGNFNKRAEALAFMKEHPAMGAQIDIERSSAARFPLGFPTGPFRNKTEKPTEYYFEGKKVEFGDWQKLLSVARNPARVEPSMVITEDGFKFYRLQDGSYADHRDPAKVDMSFDSLAALKREVSLKKTVSAAEIMKALAASVRQVKARGYQTFEFHVGDQNEIIPVDAEKYGITWGGDHSNYGSKNLGSMVFVGDKVWLDFPTKNGNIGGEITLDTSDMTTEIYYEKPFEDGDD